MFLTFADSWCQTAIQARRGGAQVPVYAIVFAGLTGGQFSCAIANVLSIQKELGGVTWSRKRTPSLPLIP